MKLTTVRITNYVTKGVTEDSNMTKSELTTAPVQKR